MVNNRQSADDAMKKKNGEEGGELDRIFAPWRNWGTYNLFWVSFWDIIFALHCNWSVNAEWDDSAMFLSLLLASLTASLFPLNWGGEGTTLVSFSGCAGGFIDVLRLCGWSTAKFLHDWLPDRTRHESPLKCSTIIVPSYSILILDTPNSGTVPGTVAVEE